MRAPYTLLLQNPAYGICQFSLFVVDMVHEVTIKTELGNTEVLYLGIIQT